MMSDYPATGIVLFDNPHVRADGVACESGKIAIEIISASELGTDYTWVTNLDYTQMANSGLSRSPRFRHSGFLRLSLYQISMELGLNVVDNRTECSVLALIFGEVQKKVCEAGLDFVPKAILPLGLREFFMPPVPEYKKKISTIFKNSRQYYSISEGRRSGDTDMTATLRVHRQDYAYKMLRLKPPSLDNWCIEKITTINNRVNEDKIKQLLEDPRPFFAKIVIYEYDDSMIGSILNHGAGSMDIGRVGKKGRSLNQPNKREWIIKEELEFLNPFAVFDAIEVLFGESYMDEPIIPKNVQNWSGRDGLSYSEGLFLENLWTSLARQDRHNPDPVSLYYQAMDRIESAKIAIQVKTSTQSVIPDLNITGYGYGRVSIRFNSFATSKQNSGINDDYVALIAKENDLIPPILHFALDAKEKAKKEIEHIEKPSDMVRSLAVMGNDGLMEMLAVDR